MGELYYIKDSVISIFTLTTIHLTKYSILTEIWPNDKLFEKMKSTDKQVFKKVERSIESNCFSSSKSVPKPLITVPSIMDGINILEGAEYFLVIYLFPIISFAGFLSNILIILIIRNKANQKALFKNVKRRIQSQIL